MREPDQVDPAAALLALADCAARRKPVPEPVADWLAAGLRTYLDGRASLKAALGLSAGHWTCETRLAYRRRNEALRAAYHLLDSDVDALAAKISRFETRTWTRSSCGDCPNGRGRIFSNMPIRLTQVDTRCRWSRA
jgi:hypothetical protein